MQLIRCLVNMDDNACVGFLQWALPQLRMRWPGFRKVRRQVCKRIQRRIDELGLTGVAAYQVYLQCRADEWPVLDHACRVTVSRFYRDRVVLEHLRRDVLPELARAAVVAGETCLRCWSAGCASGEEAYSLVLIWEKSVAHDFPHLGIDVTGSDIDEVLLHRATRGCYAYSSIKALPQAWRQSAFSRHNSDYCLQPRLRNRANFIRQDIRDKSIAGPFHLVFCRNLAFTYFEHALQLEVLDHLRGCLVEGGILVIGGHEILPEGFCGFEPLAAQRAIFRKVTVTRN